MKWDLMGTCYSGDLGHDLELMYANETASLHPPHQYTPWVTINGKVCEDRERKGGGVTNLYLAYLYMEYKLKHTYVALTTVHSEAII